VSLHVAAPVHDRPVPRRLRSAPKAAEKIASRRGFDRGYWLAHCQGYRVDGSQGRIGFVDAVRGEPGRTVLAVRAGRLGRRVLLVPTENVAFIVPRAQRIWLRESLTIVGSESLDEA